jgi:TP901 family phage tail tape measure protein
LATSYVLSLVLQAINKATGPIQQVVTGLGQVGSAAQQANAATQQAGTQGAQSMQQLANSTALATAGMQALATAANQTARMAAEAIAVGAGMFAAWLFPTQQAADFEKSMSEVKAISEATKDELAALEAAAIKWGQSSQFSVSEVAKGFVAMAQAGMTATEIVAAIPQVIQFAQIAHLDLARASEYLINVMTGLQAKVSDLTHITDVLANVTVRTTTSMQELAEGLKFVTPAAAAAGVNIDELGAALGVLSQVGIKSYMSGTMLRAMLVKLADPSKESMEALHRLHVTVDDGTGKMRNFIDVIEDLGKSGMTLQEASKIFDIRAAAGALALTQNINMLKNLRDENALLVNSAKDMASVMVDNVAVAFINLKAAVEALSIALVGPMLRAIKVVVDTARTLVNALSTITSAMQPLSGILFQIIGVFGGLMIALGATGLAVAGFLKFVQLLNFGVGAMGAILTGGIAGLTQFMGVAGAFGNLSAMVGSVTSAFVLLGKVLLTHPIGWIILAIGAATAAYTYFSGSLKKSAEAARDAAVSQRKTREEFDKLTEVFARAIPGTVDYDSALNDLIQKFPQLSSQIMMSGQSLKEHQDIINSFKSDLMVKELDALGKSAAANAQLVTQTGANLNQMTMWQKTKAAAGAIWSQSFKTSGPDDAVEDTKSKLKSIGEWYKAYWWQVTTANKIAQQTALNSLATEFKIFFKNIGVDSDTYTKATSDQLSAMFKKALENGNAFAASWVLAKGTVESFGEKAREAFEKIRKEQERNPVRVIDADEQKKQIDSIMRELMGMFKGIPTAGTDVFLDVRNYMEKLPSDARMAFAQVIEEKAKMARKDMRLNDQTAGHFKNSILQAIADWDIAFTKLGQKWQSPAMTQPYTKAANWGPILEKADAGDRQWLEGVKNLVHEFAVRNQVSEQLLLGIIQGESNFNQTVKNKSSSATGAWQFIDSTWAGQVSQFNKMVYDLQSATQGTDEYKNALGRLQARFPETVQGFSLLGKELQQMKWEERKDGILNTGIALDMIGDTLRRTGGDINKALGPWEVWTKAMKAAGGDVAAAQQALTGSLKGMAQAEYEYGPAKVMQKEVEQQRDLIKQQSQLNEARLQNEQMSAKTYYSERASLMQAEFAKELGAQQANIASLLQQGKRTEAFEATLAYTTKAADLQKQMQINTMKTAEEWRKLTVVVNEAAAKVAQYGIWLQEEASKLATAGAEREKATLSAQYEARIIGAQKMYNRIADLEKEAFERDRGIIQQKLALEASLWDKKIELASKAPGTKEEVAAKVSELQVKKDEQLVSLRTQLGILDQKRIQSLAEQTAETAKQIQTQVLRGMREMGWSAAMGPLAEEQAKMARLIDDQNIKRREMDAILSKNVANIRAEYGAESELTKQAEATRDALLQQYDALAKDVRFKESPLGQDIQRWAAGITSAFSSLVDSLMEGGADTRKALNTFFKSILKEVMAPGMKQLQQGLTDLFKYTFGGLSNTLGQLIGGFVMGLIAVVGMMLTKQSTSTFTPSGSKEGGVTQHEAMRGVIAGETSIPIAQISESLEEAMAPHLQVLRQIENNTRSGGGAQATGTLLGGNQIQVVIQGVSAAVTAAMDQYFQQYLLMGAK